MRAVVLYSDLGLRLSLLRVGEVVTLDLPEIPFQGPATVLSIASTKETAEAEGKVLHAVRFRNDDDIGTALLGTWIPPRDFAERWASRRRILILRMDSPDEVWRDIKLLRTLDWIAEANAEVGKKIFLDLSEVSTRGWANVLEIQPCPIPEKVGSGELVTGWFRTSTAQTGDLILESEPKPLGVTPGHLIWSVDRNDWVPVGCLRPGERVRTKNGTTRVVSYTLMDRWEPVYNIEVEAGHTYCVGESGVLAHNMSGAAPSAQPCPAVGGDPARAKLRASLGARPTTIPQNVPIEAHHIVPVNFFDMPLGIRLCCLGIDLNSADNGVWLPNCDYPNRVPSMHSGRTPKTYLDEVLLRFQGFGGSKNDALAIIESIRRDLLDGTLPLNNAGPC